MSENRIAASKPKRRTGCNVTSAASSGVKHRSRKPPGLFAHRPVFRQIASGLAHHPDRRHRFMRCRPARAIAGFIPGRSVLRLFFHPDSYKTSSVVFVRPLIGLMPFGPQPVHRWPVLNSESDVVRPENVHSGNSGFIAIFTGFSRVIPKPPSTCRRHFPIRASSASRAQQCGWNWAFEMTGSLASGEKPWPPPMQFTACPDFHTMANTGLFPSASGLGRDRRNADHGRARGRRAIRQRGAGRASLSDGALQEAARPRAGRNRPSRRGSCSTRCSKKT